MSGAGGMASRSWTSGRRVALCPRPWMGTLDGRTRNALKRKARDLGNKRESIADVLALTNYHKIVVAAGELTIPVIDSVLWSDVDINANIAILVSEKVSFPLLHRLSLVRRAARTRMDRGCLEAVVAIANPLAEKTEFNPLAPRLCDCGATPKQQVATIDTVWAKQALVVLLSEGEKKKRDVARLSQAIINVLEHVDMLEVETSIVSTVTETLDAARALKVLCDFNVLALDLDWRPPRNSTSSSLSNTLRDA